MEALQSIFQMPKHKPLAEKDVRRINRTKNANDIKFITSTFKTHFIFSNLSDNEL